MIHFKGTTVLFKRYLFGAVEFPWHDGDNPDGVFGPRPAD